MDVEREDGPRRALWVVAVLVGFVALAAAGLLNAQPPVYTSKTVVSMEPLPSDSFPAASTISLLAAPYAAHASADSTLTAVASETGLSFADVRAGVEVTLAAGSTNVEIKVTLPTAADTVKVGESVASRVVALATNDTILRATVSVPPSTPEETLLSPALPILTRLALMLGVALVLLGGFKLLMPSVRRRRDRRRMRSMKRRTEDPAQDPAKYSTEDPAQDPAKYSTEDPAQDPAKDSSADPDQAPAGSSSAGTASVGQVVDNR